VSIFLIIVIHVDVLTLITRWLKDALTDIFKRLLEIDLQKAMTFEAFFNAADDILSRRVVYVFSTSSARHFKFYMPAESMYVLFLYGL